jgi:hypothetical protein
MINKGNAAHNALLNPLASVGIVMVEDLDGDRGTTGTRHETGPNAAAGGKYGCLHMELEGLLLDADPGEGETGALSIRGTVIQNALEVGVIVPDHVNPVQVET